MRHDEHDTPRLRRTTDATPRAAHASHPDRRAARFVDPRTSTCRAVYAHQKTPPRSHRVPPPGVPCLGLAAALLCARGARPVVLRLWLLASH
eukprot:5552481-Prymnesium_polylepis.1